MKKIFQLKQDNKNPDRVIEAIKNELRKYVKRERAKKLPEGSDFWDLTCRFGGSSDESKAMPFAQIIKALDEAKENDWQECFIEITSNAKTKAVQIDEEDQQV